MLTQNDSHMAANAFCHAVEMAKEAIQQTLQCYTAPHVIYRPKLYLDGNEWCALLGESLQSGVCGFGGSPQLAMADFDKAWYKLQQPVKTQ